MSDIVKMTSGVTIGLVALYWISMMVARSFGLYMPDPVDLLPFGWRIHLP